MEVMPAKLNQWIIQEIEERNWSIRELARRAELSHATINAVLAEKSQPGPDFCTGVARALRVPPERVFRLAGLLPQKPEETAIISEFVYLLNQLPTEEQEELLLVAKAWVKGRKQQRSIKTK